jgi:hypothetical protein
MTAGHLNAHFVHQVQEMLLFVMCKLWTDP